MAYKPHWNVLLLVLSASPLLGQATDTSAPLTSLLHQETISFQLPSKPGQAPRDLRPLTDNKVTRSIEFKLTPGIALDLTCQLSTVSTAERLRVIANTGPLKEKPLPRIEVLVSTLSNRAGFQSIRSVVMKPDATQHEMELPATAAKWLIVRIISPREPMSLQISEIDLLGNIGLPRTRYAFKEAPATAFQVLKEVQKSVAIQISDDEASLFKDATDGKLDTWTFAEAALLSSGVSGQEKRKQYLTRLDQITEQAKNAIQDAKTPYQKGEQLLRWLHTNVMDGGYETSQTDLSMILENGKFNCVSSATLYNIVGQRLGLDLRAIEVPDHAFSIQYDGTKHADVETTNAAGFNPARDPRILQSFTQQTGFSYIPDQHPDKRREVDNIGLMALTYFNHGVSRGEQGDYAIALVDYFRALSLDPEFPSAIQNVLSTLHHWSGEKVEQQKFEEALGIVDMGLRLAPQDRRFRHNQQALWQAWALSEIKNNHRQAALEILERATKTLPQAGFEQMQAYAYIHPGEQLAQAADWKGALTLAEKGIATVPPMAQSELRRWRNNIYNRWTIASVEKKDYATSADVLEQAIMADPTEQDFTRNLGFVAQEWLIITESQEGLAAAELLLAKLANRFPSVDDVRKVIETFLGHTVLDLIKTGEYTKGLELIGRQQQRFRESAVHDLKREIFEAQARLLAKEKQWEKTIAVYRRGLREIPGDRQLVNNLVVSWQRWANEHQKRNDWKTAGEIYLKALDSGVDNREMEKRVGFCVQELAQLTWKKEGVATAERHLADWVKKKPALKSIRTAVAVYVQGVVQQHQRQGEPEKALIAANRCREMLLAKDHGHFVRVVCDQWSQSHVKNMEWDQALAVYTLGLKSLPKDRHLTRNAVVTWDQRANRLIKKKQWGEAIKIYNLALEQFPNHPTLRNNLKYCLQQANQ